MRTTQKLTLGLMAAAIFSNVGCSSSGDSGTASPPSATTVPTATTLTDINVGLGITQAVDSTSNWISMGSNFYFASSAPGSANGQQQLWAYNSSTGALTNILNLGYSSKITAFVMDTRSGRTPSYFYFIVDNQDVYVSNGTAAGTVLVRSYDDNSGTIIASAINNTLFFQGGSGAYDLMRYVPSGAGTGTETEVYTTGTASVADDVVFIPGTATMYFHTNATSEVLYSASSTGVANIAATTVLTLGTNATVGEHAVVGDNLYFQVDDTDENGFDVFVSLAGAAAGTKITKDVGTDFLANVDMYPGSSTVYIVEPTGTGAVFGHLGATGTAAETIYVSGAGTAIAAAAVAADRIYFQIADTDTAADDNNIYFSSGTSAATLLADNTGTTYEALGDDVSFIAGSSTMYFYNSASGTESVFSHTTGTTATLVAATAGELYASAKTQGDDLYYQVDGGANDLRVFKSVAGAAAGFVYSVGTTHFADTVTFMPSSTGSASSVMYFYGNRLSSMDRVYRHSGAAASAATEIYSPANATGGNITVASNGARRAQDNAMVLLAQGTTNRRMLYAATSSGNMQVLGTTAAPFSPSQDDNVGCNGGTPVAIGSRLFFAANDGSSGCELYTTDGSTTAIVEDIFAGGGYSQPQDLTVAGTRLYFTAMDNSDTADSAKRFLFYSDSPYNAASTHKAIIHGPGTTTDLTNPFGGTTVRYFYYASNRLFFAAYDGTTNHLLYVLDTTAANNAAAGAAKAVRTSTPTSLVVGQGGYNASTNPYPVMQVGSVFVLNAGLVGSLTTEVLYTIASTLTPGTTNPTAITTTTSTIAADADAFLTNVVSGGKLLLIADSATYGDRQLYATDGASAGTTTTLVRKINNATGAAASAGITVANVKMAGTYAYFLADDEITNSTNLDLWVTNAAFTSASKLTELASSANAGLSNLVALGSNLLFQIGVDTAVEYGLGASTGGLAGITSTTGVIHRTGSTVAAGAALVRDLTGAKHWNSKAFFTHTAVSGTFTPAVGIELWVTDGTAGGTSLVKDINQLPVPDANKVYNGNGVAASSANWGTSSSWFLFPATDGVRGTELWYTDGTSANTGLVSNINTDDTDATSPSYIGTANGVAYYFIKSPTRGVTIYRIQ